MLGALPLLSHGCARSCCIVILSSGFTFRSLFDKIVRLEDFFVHETKQTGLYGGLSRNLLAWLTTQQLRADVQRKLLDELPVRPKFK